MAKYRVVVGINFPDGSGGETRVEPGGTIDDTALPKKTLDAWLHDGVLEKVGGRPAKPADEEGED
jgi:hypothetical protein